ncbi:hypothetical protein PtA15_6A395 [Puccinia triticina]|uniref:Uncharacterized protein n=1 Tax=Puccinia triticina TaxID=208348 RepID=A0ABY7CNR7_9BASI|nr:uncharacterized protein PtA15_6A395 [Puccinia triticina]WAQ85766.1 hypothetical protein PtA15_6A395 [Puccinia triticina]
MDIMASPRLAKSTRETKGLIDALGGGLATSTPRSARAARKPQNTISDSQRPSLTPKRSDSSLSDLSDTHDHHSSRSTSSSINIFHPQTSPLPSPARTPQLQQPAPDPHHHLSVTLSSPQSSRSVPSTPNRSMKAKQKPSLRKTIIKRTHSSSFGLLRNQRGNPKLNRSRRLTDSQKKELEQTRLKLLENLQEEEELIKSSQHPILISLEENVEIGKELRLSQARKKFEQLNTYLDRLNYERQQRIWDTWTDSKIRIQTEMIVDCQIRLNRAPFEFLISNDTTNLQAIFHLTPTPPASYLKPIFSLNRPDLKEVPMGAASTVTCMRSTGGPMAKASSLVANEDRKEGPGNGSSSHPPEASTKKVAQRSGEAETADKRKEKSSCSSSRGLAPSLDQKTGGGQLLGDDRKPGQEEDGLMAKESLDLIDGIRRQRVQNHSIWQLSQHDILDDLKLIHRHRRRLPPHQLPNPSNQHHPHPYAVPLHRGLSHNI